MTYNFFKGTIVFSCLLMVACSKKKDRDETPAFNAYAIGAGNNLLLFHLNTPSTVSSKAIIGLQSGESIRGIDVRPANKQLYAIGSSNRLYTINTSTGQATAIGAGPFTPALTGTFAGIDFNPMADRLRIVTSSGQNLRIHPETGVLAGQDVGIFPLERTVSGCAHTNNFVGATSTMLYDIDATDDRLYTQNPPNNGMLTLVGSLGVDVDGNNGFDISGTDNKAYAILSKNGAAKLYSINLLTGAATVIGDFPADVRAFAVAL